MFCGCGRFRFVVRVIYGTEIKGLRSSALFRDLKQQTFVSHGRRPEVTLRILFHTAHGITFVSGSADPRTARFRFSQERPPFKTSR